MREKRVYYVSQVNHYCFFILNELCTLRKRSFCTLSSLHFSAFKGKLLRREKIKHCRILKLQLQDVMLVHEIFHIAARLDTCQIPGLCASVRVYRDLAALVTILSPCCFISAALEVSPTLSPRQGCSRYA